MYILYTKPNCSYCNKTKELLEHNKLSYKEYHIGSDIDIDEVRKLFPTAKLAPVIVLDNKYIGGYTELVNLLIKE